MAVLGEDGRGYELARKLEEQGVWRGWLGESLYKNFINYLSNQSSWNSFMSSDPSMSRSQIHLQLRARALLFDKASSFPSSSLSNLNPLCLQLHGDDVYFTLEDCGAPSKVQSQKFRQEEFPETWYNQFIENYRANKPYMLSLTNRESHRRNPTEMSNYLKLLERHKRRKIELKEDGNGGFGNSNLENKLESGSLLGGDTFGGDNTCFFPETMFMMNCVPDNAIAPRTAVDEKQNVEFFTVLDTLPQMRTKSSIMLERLGIMPEHMEQGLGQSRSKIGLIGNRKQLSEEQAKELSKKVVARVLTTAGFDGASEISVEVLSQFLSCHINKLGGILKVLADSYRKQCSAMELIKMFLKAAGNSNLATLAEHVKDNRNIVQPSAQQIQNMQPQSPLPQQSTLQLPQQIPRQMHPQIPQMVHPQNLTLQQQQQLERMRRQQASSPRPSMSMDKDRPMVEVKLENPPDLPMDNNAFSAMSSRQAQMQLRQHQFAQIQRIMGSAGTQLRQRASVQIPPMQPQGVTAVRARPVKVEGFQELMGGDSSSKQNSDESRLTSPSK